MVLSLQRQLFLNQPTNQPQNGQEDLPMGTVPS